MPLRKRGAYQRQQKQKKSAQETARGSKARRFWGWGVICGFLHFCHFHVSLGLTPPPVTFYPPRFSFMIFIVRKLGTLEVYDQKARPKQRLSLRPPAPFHPSGVRAGGALSSAEQGFQFDHLAGLSLLVAKRKPSTGQL